MNNLKSQCNEIEKEILSLKSDNPNFYPISDGIVNIEKYLASKYKILWILKESNDVKEINGKITNVGSWKYNEALNEQSWETQSNTGKIAFKRMALSAYGILNNFRLVEDFSKTVPINISFEAIKNIAVININKFPGGTQSFKSAIEKAFDKYLPILRKQIDVYNPDIIIGGNTLKLFADVFSLSKLERIPLYKNKSADFNYYKSKDRLFIDAYHPAFRESTITEEDYINANILAAKNWSEGI